MIHDKQALNEVLLQHEGCRSKQSSHYIIKQIPKSKNNYFECYINYFIMVFAGIVLLLLVSYLPLLNIYYAYSGESCLNELNKPINITFKEWLLISSYCSLICLFLNLLQKLYDIYNIYYYSKYYKIIKNIFCCLILCSILICFIWLAVGYILINENKQILDHCTKYLKNEIYSNEVVMIMYLIGLVIFSICCSMEININSNIYKHFCI